MLKCFIHRQTDQTFKLKTYLSKYLNVFKVDISALKSYV